MQERGETRRSSSVRSEVEKLVSSSREMVDSGTVDRAEDQPRHSGPDTGGGPFRSGYDEIDRQVMPLGRVSQCEIRST